MTILGIDISKWNGNWDAAKAKQAGAIFVFIKASQAAFTDIQFKLNWQKAKDAGLLRGAYHYLDYTKSGAAQANYFADLLKDDPGELPPVLDYELRTSDNKPATALGFVRAFLDQLSARTELFEDATIKKPMIYTSPGFWKECGEQTNKEYWLQFPLWLAHYTTSPGPLLPSPWQLWNFWQYTAKGPGETYGSESLSIDMNRFNGSLNELLEFIGMQAQVPDEPSQLDSLVQRITTLEQSMSGLQGGSVDGFTQRLSSAELNISTQAQALGLARTELGQRLSLVEQKLGVPAPQDNSGTYATCTLNGLNVRSGPGVSFKVIGTLIKGKVVKVIRRQAGWSQIEDPAGWCSETYLNFQGVNPSPSPTPTPSPTPSNELYGVCNTSALNVRKGPGVSNPIVGGITYGQRVRILTQQNGWAQLQTPAGWCNQSYLSIS